MTRSARWADDFVRAAVAEVATAAQQHTHRSTPDRLTKCPTTSAIEGWVQLCTVHGLEAMDSRVDWIYAKYAALLQQDLSGSRTLTNNGLQQLIPSLVPLTFGGISSDSKLLNASLYATLPARQRRHTTWYR